MIEETIAKRGPKPNPLTQYQRANEKANKARAAYEKVQALAEAKAVAEAEEQEAYQQLQESLSAIAVPPGIEER